MEQKLYLVKIWGDVDPSIDGPFNNDTDRLDAARQYRKDEGDDNGIYRLDIDTNGNPNIYSFSGYEIECVDDFIDHYTLMDIPGRADSQDEEILHWDDEDWNIIQEFLTKDPDNIRRVWTVVDVDGESYITPGIHYVNRMGYVISNEPFESEDENYIW